MKTSVDRRQFIVSAGTGLLVVAVDLPGIAAAADAPATGAAAGGVARVSPYIEIAPNGAVKLWSPTSEMGQGTHTAHAAIIADELGVDFTQVSIETAEPSDPFRRAGPPGQPSAMGSGGSWGVRAWVDPLRKSAAQAREMLVGAAATRLGVPAAELRAQSGAVEHAASGRKLAFAELLADAAKLPPPAAPALRPASERRYVGNAKLRRLDIPGKVDGSAIYSADFRRPGMLYACARLAPVRAANVASVDKGSVMGRAGVVDVVEFPGGVAVVAKTHHAAMSAASALVVEFKKTPGDSLDTEAIRLAMQQGLGADTKAVLKNEGDFDAAKAAAARVLTADYEVPYLNHAPMEPWSCTVERDAGGTWHLWAPTQVQDRIRGTAARTLGVPVAQVRVHTLLLGGGFGRRLADDGIPPAVLVSKALDGKPVKFFWTREGEFLAGYGRPCIMARLTAALDAKGNVTGLHVRTSGPSMALSFNPLVAPADIATFVDPQALQNLPEARYKVGAVRLDFALRHNHFPNAPWRSVGATHTAFFLESFVDEIARATKTDPLEMRRKLLAGDARALNVINVAADKAGWGKPLPKGHALGIAYFESFGSLCAQVAEVSVAADGTPHVHRIVCAMDCGEVVTPDGATSQIEGGIIQSLSAAMYETVHIEKGASVERNFDGYRLMRINEAPAKIEVHLIASGEKIGGIGEPPVPPVAPAVANAFTRASGGKVLRRLPFAQSAKSAKPVKSA